MAITKAYYRNALGALLVFDILKIASFQNLDLWWEENLAARIKTNNNSVSLFLPFRFNEIRANAGMDCSIILVGNKLDQRHIRAVLQDDVKRYAEARNIQ